MGVLQAILLEEVAYSAVELYSGRLRFSDAELLAIELEQTEADIGRLAEADAPLRVMFVGQVSAGKSTLINALLGDDRAETDMAPTTPGLVTYEAAIGGVPCHWIDSRGIDGSAETLAALLAELREADLIVWVLRASRPGRAADLALLQRFEASFAAEPARRRPEILGVATCIDQLAPGWPYPENRLPAEVQQVFAAAVAAIAGDMGGLRPLPVCAVSPDWNIEPLRTEMEAGLGHALLVQRNRRRLAAGRGGPSVAGAARSGRGFLQGAGRIGSRLARRAFAGGSRPPE
jgi:predicted GTPase